MSAFESELRACLAEVLGEEPPVPDTEPLLFYRQWLAGRNLGLVPIAEPASVDWPGHWLARVRTADGEHAVVMFGSPSGPLFDPAGALSDGGAIEAGWMVAPLDFRREVGEQHGATSPGSVAGLLVAPEAEAPLVAVESVAAIAGRGLEGDRYAVGRGTFSGPGRGYQLTLVEAETLDELGVSWERARRNVVTRGVSLNALVGRRFRVGGAEGIGRRLCEPCAHLERVSGSGLLRPLVHRGGLRADILDGGTIHVGDDVVPC